MAASCFRSLVPMIYVVNCYAAALCARRTTCDVLNLDHSFAPQGGTMQIHALYKKAIGQRINGCCEARRRQQWARVPVSVRRLAA
jgi:hypothetical protein